MSTDEVVKASKGKATPDPDSKANSSDDYESLLVALYKTGRFDFYVRFLFEKETRTLSRVQLELKNPAQCNLVWAELNSKYGKPDHEPTFAGVAESAVWRDRKANNGIAILKVGEKTCSIDYWQLRGKRNEGL